jgi:hypothetical protein
MKLAARWIAILVFTAFGAAAKAQNGNVSLSDILKSMRDMRAVAESRALEKGLRARTELLSSSHQTREAEEATNDIARNALQLSLFANGGINTKAIYGNDDRFNYGPRLTPGQRKAADATAILIKLPSVSFAPSGRTFDLPGGNIIDPATNRGLCTNEQAAALEKPREPFFDEPNPGFCSGFRVGRNRILTAGHCIRDAAECNDTRFVFGFYANKLQPQKAIPVSQMYSCKRIIGGTLIDNGPDWRLIEVDRDIAQGSNVQLRSPTTKPELVAGEGVTVVGYPLGLPVKIAPGATVRGFGKGFFVANLDTYEGNSGSAVFNSDALTKSKLLAEGVLVRGENDFDLTSPCYISKRCPTNGCRGEDVTLATEVITPPN